MELTKIELKKRNELTEKFNAFKKAQSEKQESLNVEAQARKEAKKVGTTNFNITANTLLNILNAGANGISVSKLLELKPLQHEKENFSIDTLKRDFNRNVEKYSTQWRQEKLNESGIMVIFKVTKGKKAANLKASENNIIAVESGFEVELLNYIKSFSNFNESWVK